MSTNYQQPTSPEMRPEYAARFMTVKYARYGLHKALLSNQEFAQRLAGSQIVKEEIKVFKTNDYTEKLLVVEQQPVVVEEMPNNVAYFESSDKEYRTLAANNLVDKAFENEAA